MRRLHLPKLVYRQERPAALLKLTAWLDFYDVSVVSAEYCQPKTADGFTVARQRSRCRGLTDQGLVVTSSSIAKGLTSRHA